MKYDPFSLARGARPPGRRLLPLLGVLLLLTGVAGAAKTRFYRHKTRHENGNLKTQYTTYRDADGRHVLHGPYYRFYDTKEQELGLNYRRGQRHGPFDAWYRNGQLKATGRYDRGNKVGTWVSFYRTANPEVGPDGVKLPGQKENEATYADGKLHGWAREWRRNGTLSEEAEFAEGKRHGVTRTFDAQGRKLRETTYAKGQKHGPERSWFADGARRGAGHWAEGKRHGAFQVWLEDGTLVAETNWQHGQKHGPERLWYDNGQRLSEMVYVEGKREGKAYEWWPNGNLRTQGTYENDKLEGVWLLFNQQGVQLSAGTRVNGLEYKGLFAEPGAETSDGPYLVLRFEKGDVVESLVFENGRAFTGEWTEKYPDGQLRRRLDIVAGRYHGLEQIWFPDGVLQHEREWRDNRLQGLSKTWYKSGKRLSEIQFAQSQKHGLEQQWWESGEVMLRSHYQAGQRHGTHEEYFANGRLRLQANYAAGKLDGRYRSWNEAEKLLMDGVYRQGEPWDGTFIEPGLLPSQHFVNRYRQGELVDGVLHGQDGQPVEGEVVERWPDSLEEVVEFVNAPGGGTRRQVSYVNVGGQVKRRVTFRAGRRHGPEVRFYESGQKQLECHWLDNHLQGVYEEYFEDGSRMWVTELKDGKRHGREVHWYRPGEEGERSAQSNPALREHKIIADGQWRRGEPWDGTFLLPGANGMQLVSYRHGKRLGLRLPEGLAARNRELEPR